VNFVIVRIILITDFPPAAAFKVHLQEKDLQFQNLKRHLGQLGKKMMKEILKVVWLGRKLRNVKIEAQIQYKI
jgi:hypothetical protein